MYIFVYLLNYNFYVIFKDSRRTRTTTTEEKKNLKHSSLLTADSSTCIQSWFVPPHGSQCSGAAQQSLQSRLDDEALVSTVNVLGLLLLIYECGVSSPSPCCHLLKALDFMG